MSADTGKLHIIATPIGNLEDITLRALRTLKECDLVLAEDTRMGKKLLSHYDIKTPIKSYHAHTEGKHAWIEELIASGSNIGVITDAGTPGISDPGETLVAHVRDRFGPRAVVAIPGPSALTAALSIAGIPVHEFVFMGFLPHKKGRLTALREISDSDRTVVFYESTHRIMKALAYLKDNLEPRRTVVVARELTKVYEETIVGTPQEVLHTLEGQPERQRGEFVVLVQGKSW